MVKEKESPYGYIYRATNIQNGKNYIGQTVTSRWADDKIPIEERWNEEIREGYAKQKRGEKLRYIENAVIKHGEENFELKVEDVANNQEELDEKEDHYIIKYDTMNPDKGYNMREGGRGGRLSEALKEYFSKRGTEKWQEDLEYQNKQINERRERAKDPEWLDKMAEVNQEIARNPETLEKMSESLSEKWKDQKYQENVSRGVKNNWQTVKFRERQFKAKVQGKREIQDKGEFLKDIQEMKKKDLNLKHDMDGKCINDRIKEMLGHHGINNFSQAKKYLENKNLDNVLKDINENMKTQSQDFKGKKEISNKREFLEDIQNMQRKDIDTKYNMNRTTVNKRIREMLGEHGVKNYTEAKKYLEGKNLDKVVKDINERLSDQSHKYEGKTEISNKREFLEDIQNLQKNEIDMKYGMDAKTVNNKIEEMLGEHGVRNYTGAKEYLQDKNLDDVVKDIEDRSSEKQDDTPVSENGLKGSAHESREESDIKVPNQESDEEKSEVSIEDNSEKSSEDDKEDTKEESATETAHESSIIKAKDTPEEANNEQRLETSGLPPGKRSDQEMIEEHIKAHEDFLDRMNELSKRGWVDYYVGKTIVVKDRSMDNWERPEPHENTSGKDYDGIDNYSDAGTSNLNSDYNGIDKSSENESDDLRGIDEDNEEGGKDFEGIDDHSREGSKDYEARDEEYGTGEHGGEA